MRVGPSRDSVRDLYVDLILLHVDQRSGAAIEKDLCLGEQVIEHRACPDDSGGRTHIIHKDRENLARRDRSLAKRRGVQQSCRRQLNYGRDFGSGWRELTDQAVVEIGDKRLPVESTAIAAGVLNRVASASPPSPPKPAAPNPAITDQPPDGDSFM